MYLQGAPNKTQPRTINHWFYFYFFQRYKECGNVLNKFKCVITADVEQCVPASLRHASPCSLFFQIFDELVSANKSLFNVTCKVLRASWTVAVYFFFKKSPRKDTTWCSRMNTSFLWKPHIVKYIFTALLVSGVPRGRGFGGFNPPPPKFRSFDKVEPDCKLSGKCLVFLFQHPN